MKYLYIPILITILALNGCSVLGDMIGWSLKRDHDWSLYRFPGHSSYGNPSSAGGYDYGRSSGKHR